MTTLSFDDFFPFARPYIDEAAIEDVGNCLRSGWLTTGPRTQEFEKALGTYHQAPHVIAVSSGTMGLLLSLSALDLQPGDEVITTSLTFVATLNTIIQAGGTPVLADIDPTTRNLDPARVEALITPKTKAIIPVHFAGLPVDLDAFYALAQKHHLTIIEDAAHASGTLYKGKKIGATGHIQILSFHPNKNMTTGEGGAILVQDEALATKIRQLAFHGIDRNAWNRFGKNGRQGYDVVRIGYKANMMDLQAILGLHQLDKLDGFIDTRATLANTYQELLQKSPYLDTPKMPAYDHRHGWHLFTVLIRTDAPLNRDQFMEKMKERNVGTGLHYQACHHHSALKDNVRGTDATLPHSTQVGDTIVSLPLHPQMTKEEVEKIVAIINDVFQKAAGDQT